MAHGGEVSSADERDPQLRFDVVFSSRSVHAADAAAERLRSDGFTVRSALVEQRNRSGRLARTHEIRVPAAQARRAARVIASSPVVADAPTRLRPPGSLRERVGESGYEGLVTVIGMAVALLIIGAYLIHAS